eukprot:TRINITY_DN16220_c0_g1_i1.p1 TRINITY_DN16220_c0_g1~~TRINITY_DN16220_c0_g1_i1.p1  ORF type:complete len:161 (-),score=39.80 TRINITY_DN16220_c0_g1_i1:32-514(-)
MIMETFFDQSKKYSYSICIHSGDGPDINIVDYKAPPKNRNQYLKILQKMQVHSEYCSSGDSTVKALELAVNEVTNEEADDYFVFLVSDANLKRYGIHPKTLSDIINKNKKVNTFCIFLASFQDEADQIVKQLPVNKSFVCLNTKELPAIFKKIFTNVVDN